MPNPFLQALGLGAKNSDALPIGALQTWLKSSRQNAYVDVGPYEIYLRKARRGSGDRPDTLDVANIKNRDRDQLGEDALEKKPPEARPPRGKFKELMEILEREAKANGLDEVYVENIFNEFLPEILAKYGYVLDPESMPDAPSYRKKVR